MVILVFGVRVLIRGWLSECISVIFMILMDRLMVRLEVSIDLRNI